MTESKGLEATQRVARSLAALVESDGALFVCCAAHFARVRRLVDGGLRIELPTNELVPPERWIDAASVDLLREAGYALPKVDELYFARTIDLAEGEEDAAARALVRLLALAYDAPPSAAPICFVSASSAERPSAARCADEIRGYRDSPDASGWDRLCEALLEAELDLAVVPAFGSDGAPPRVRSIHGPEGLLAAAAFTGAHARRLAAPRGLPHAVLRGADALRLAAAQGLDALVIDPRGPLPVQLRGAIFAQLALGERPSEEGGLDARAPHG